MYLATKAALNEYRTIPKAEDLVKIAQMADSDKAIELYRQALEIQNFNLDAWDGLITAYKSAEKQVLIYRTCKGNNICIDIFPSANE